MQTTQYVMKADPAYRWGKPVPLDLKERPSSLGLRLAKDCRMSGLVILGNPLLDVAINTAPGMRHWIRKHGDERPNR